MTTSPTNTQADPPSQPLTFQPPQSKQIGNYSLGTEIGSGAFGKVFLGTHIITGESVAIKVFDKFLLSQTPEDLLLIQKEISILKIIKHKHIAQLYQIMETPRYIYIVMEYCEGKDLMDYIITKTRLTEMESLKLFQQLISALTYLHNQHIAHRDIKIDNMLLDAQMNLKLVDFGLSTKYEENVLLTQPCGTVVYAAPEVLEGKEYNGMLIDVWSSGIVLYGMISGYLPFCDQDDEVNRQSVLSGKIEMPEFFSKEVKDLLAHMLDMDVSKRYTLQDIQEHEWFGLNEGIMLPGIVIGKNKIPIDERILNMIQAYGLDKDSVRRKVEENKFDEESAMYYLLVKKAGSKGFESVSDLCSEEFIEFILEDEYEEEEEEEDDKEGKSGEEEKKEMESEKKEGCELLNDIKEKEEDDEDDKNNDENNNDNNNIKESSNVNEGKENALEGTNSDEIVNGGDKEQTTIKDNDVSLPVITNTNLVESTISNKPSSTNVNINTDINNAITIPPQPQQQQPIVNSSETASLSSSQPVQLKPTYIATTNIEFHFSPTKPSPSIPKPNPIIIPSLNNSFINNTTSFSITPSSITPSTSTRPTRIRLKKPPKNIIAKLTRPTKSSTSKQVTQRFPITERPKDKSPLPKQQQQPTLNPKVKDATINTKHKSMTQHNSKSCISKQIKSTSQQKLNQHEDTNVSITHINKKPRKYTKQDIASISHRLYTSSNRCQLERIKGNIDLSKIITPTNLNNGNDNSTLTRKNNVKHLDSSVVQSQRHLSPFATRDLSYSPKQAMLNEKSRLMKMPWKYKKNGIDNNESIDDVYQRYKDKLTKRENSRILNLKQYKQSNTMTTTTLTGKTSFNDKTYCNNNNNNNNMTVKHYIKQFHQEHKRIHNGMEVNDSYNKTYEPLTKPMSMRYNNKPIRKRTNANTYFYGNSHINNNDNSTCNMNTSISVIFNNNKNETFCKKNVKQVLPGLYEGPIDLSCVIHCVKNVDECVEYLRKRMDMHKMQYYIQDKKGLKFYCTKNGVHFDIEIKRICGRKKGEWLMYLKVRERQRIFGSCRKVIEDIIG